jgi:hypothetical protein
MDGFENLIASLRKLATDSAVDLHHRLRGAETAIESYFGRAPSEFTRLRDIASDGKQRPNENDFWRSVEDIASQLSEP